MPSYCRERPGEAQNMKRTTITRLALAAGLMTAGIAPSYGQVGTAESAPDPWARAGTLRTSPAEYGGTALPAPTVTLEPDSRLVPAAATTPTKPTPFVRKTGFVQTPAVGRVIDPTFPVGPGGF